MRLQFTLLALATFAPVVRAEEPKKTEPPTTAQVQKAAERGFTFIVEDAAKWRKEKECSTCHHGTMTIWALAEAKSRGYSVKDETFTDVVKWTKDRLLANIDKPRDTRDGWKMVNSSALYLSAMAQAVPKQTVLTAEELKKIAGHLVRHQEKDGEWAWSSAPAKNRPPPFFESDEVATLLADIALAPQVPADPKEKSDIRDAREKGLAWLAKEKPTETTQALALRLFRDVKLDKTAKELQPQIDALLKRQNADGGWGQLKEAASDAYATGQVLYFLNIAGLKADMKEMSRGVAFLVSTQKDDGSWPMKRRGHPGVTPSDFTWPIVHLGSTWATIALAHCAPK